VLSPVGVYPISVALTGSAAANYSVGSVLGSLTIAKAPAVLTVSLSTSTPALGSPVIVNVQVVSTTGGVPTGSVTVLDGATVLAVVQLTAGSAALSASALAAGSHSLSSVYSGDSNFLGGTSAAAVVTIGAGADFTLAATGATSQSVPSGSAATFNFAVAMQGATLSSPITLAVQGVPVGATASLESGIAAARRIGDELYADDPDAACGAGQAFTAGFVQRSDGVGASDHAVRRCGVEEEESPQVFRGPHRDVRFAVRDGLRESHQYGCRNRQHEELYAHRNWDFHQFDGDSAATFGECHASGVVIDLQRRGEQSQQEEQQHAREEDERHAHTGLAIDLGDEIRCRRRRW